MDYEKLSKLFYKLDPDLYEEELEKRKNSYGSYVTPLSIRGFRKGKIIQETYELFYVNIAELMSLNNKVLLNSSKISSLISKLPSFVVEPYFEKLIINEAQSTNEIEGIRSTKQELKEALSELVQPEPKNKKFKGLMKTYLYIDDIRPFKDIKYFRELYDNLVSDEIKKKDAPDGELFRKGYVEINNGTSTTHIGVSSEEKIRESLIVLINYLDDDSQPELYRYMVAHYYYEYIHPFYDGNGRTGRFLVCSYLSRYLERYSAITFSYAINKDKSKYYRALEEIPSPLNKGEMTFYLIDMLELLSKGQEGIIDDLELNFVKLERINDYLHKDDWKDRQDERDLLRFIISVNVFVDEELNIPVADLIKVSNNSRYLVNKIMDNLESEGYVDKVSQKPKSYKVRDGFLEDILLIKKEN